jgi:hypothetical protein
VGGRSGQESFERGSASKRLPRSTVENLQGFSRIGNLRSPHDGEKEERVNRKGIE